MAGDWIKMRVDLTDDPAVIGIAAATGLDEFSVVGRLHRLWSWADQQTTDGNATGVTLAWLDRYVSAAGFAQAMVNFGWLRETATGLSLPNYERHSGETGKQRGLTAKRAAKHRGKSNANSNASAVTKSAPTEEQNTEDSSVSVISDSTVKQGSNHRGRSRPPAKSGSVPSEIINFEVSDIEFTASQAFKRANYRGNDGAIFWKMSALAFAGKISEFEFHDALDAAGDKGKNKPGYARGCLRELLARRALPADADAWLNAVKIKPECPTSPPTLPELEP